MSGIVAVGHALGAIFTAFVFEVFVEGLAAREKRRNQTSAAAEASLALDIPVNRLDDPENQHRVIQYGVARFSPDKFLNRLADFLWWLQMGVRILGALGQVGWLLLLIWLSRTGPVAWWAAWLIVPIGVFSWAVASIIALICRLLTGSLPGQPQQVRKQLAELAARFARERS